MHSLKVACLCYTSSMVSYQGKLFKIADLLTVKSNILAKTCKLVRNKIYGAAYDGPDLQKYQDERGFVIEPLMNETGDVDSPLKSKQFAFGTSINPTTLREFEPFEPNQISTMTKEPIYVDSTQHTSVVEQRRNSKLQQSQY